MTTPMMTKTKKTPRMILFYDNMFHNTFAMMMIMIDNFLTWNKLKTLITLSHFFNLSLILSMLCLIFSSTMTFLQTLIPIMTILKVPDIFLAELKDKKQIS